mmetsp:Transcript_38655/g.109316  ORF Transcript_38655/g.109316 Transcript_38655/m.109316 type:complete len:211 (+) Transcript_38655:1299-1931(+)
MDGKAKVCALEHRLLSIGDKHEVAWLDVPVDYVPGVALGYHPQDAPGDLCCTRLSVVPLLYPIAQLPSRGRLHHHVDVVFVFKGVVQGYAVEAPSAKPVHAVYLQPQALDVVLALQLLLRDDLHGAHLAVLSVAYPPALLHNTEGSLAQHLVVKDLPFLVNASLQVEVPVQTVRPLPLPPTLESERALLSIIQTVLYSRLAAGAAHAFNT